MKTPSGVLLRCAITAGLAFAAAVPAGAQASRAPNGQAAAPEVILQNDKVLLLETLPWDLPELARCDTPETRPLQANRRHWQRVIPSERRHHAPWQHDALAFNPNAYRTGQWIRHR